MSDRFALFFGAVLILAILADVFLNSGGALLFLARKFAGLIEYLAFWR